MPEKRNYKVLCEITFLMITWNDYPLLNTGVHVSESACPYCLFVWDSHLYSSCIGSCVFCNSHRSQLHSPFRKQQRHLPSQITLLYLWSWEKDRDSEMLILLHALDSYELHLKVREKCSFNVNGKSGVHKGRFWQHKNSTFLSLGDE